MLARLTPTINRVKSAKLAMLQYLGRVPEGAARYRSLCPKGAGTGPDSHEFSEQKRLDPGSSIGEAKDLFAP